MLMNPDAFAGNARALAAFSCEKKCSDFDKPVKVLVGDKDTIITEEMAQTTAAAFPGGKLEVINGIGHSIMVEDPERFLSILKDFMKEL